MVAHCFFDASANFYGVEDLFQEALLIMIEIARGLRISREAVRKSKDNAILVLQDFVKKKSFEYGDFH